MGILRVDWREKGMISRAAEYEWSGKHTSRRQYGLLCQGKPHTGRLRASNRVTCTWFRSAFGCSCA